MKGMEKERDLVAATARAVNHFKKTNPNAACLEIIMFNGTPQDILRFAETRVQKQGWEECSLVWVNLLWSRQWEL